MNTLIAEDEIFTKHLTGKSHPESPFRFKVCKYALQIQGLLRKDNTIHPRRATDAELLLCHTPDYIEEVQNNIQDCLAKGIDDGSYQLSTGDVQISIDSETVARYAVGAILEAVDSVMKGTAKNVFCLVRPPGHHAYSDHGMGFCIYNNVAIGAAYACQKYGCQRVLIVDWDVHHGNGTQEIFYGSSKVFYFSTHNGTIYPGTGRENEIGKGEGKGFTLNYPLNPRQQDPRQAIREIFSEVLNERMKIYQPDFVFISAGFDAHQWDPLGNFNLTTEDFVDLTHIVKEIAEKYAKGRLVSALEGGYDLDALAQVVPAHVKAMA